MALKALTGLRVWGQLETRTESPVCSFGARGGWRSLDSGLRRNDGVARIDARGCCRWERPTSVMA